MALNFAALAAGFLSGVLGAMGLGGGTVLILYLTLWLHTEQITAAGVNLLFFLPIAAVAVVRYALAGKIQIRRIAPVLVGGMVGAGIGLPLARQLGNGKTAHIFGLLLIAAGLHEIFKKTQKGLENKKKE